MSARLDGKVTLVTGAAGGIGGSVAELFQRQGAIVVASDRAGSPYDCDVTDRAQVDGLVAGIVRRHGRVDVVVHAAALTGGTGSFLEVTSADWGRYIGTNLDGTFHVCQAGARAMAGGGVAGAIVVIGSVNSHAAEPLAAAYVASKHGVLGLVRAMAVDLAPHCIRANLIAPGPIVVPRNQGLFSTAGSREMFARAVPAGRAGTPDAVAYAALYFASEEAAYTTGASLAVDGGTLAMVMERVGPSV